MKRKKIYLSVAGFFIITTSVISLAYFLLIPSIPGMFRLNKQLQEEGYYMAEFEFKMLGITYYIGRGEYLKAISSLNRLHEQLKTRDGLIKLPTFKNKKEEMEFYLNLQNPETGAFMDDSYPLCTYTGPTGNVLNHLDALAMQTGKPIKLKYPLKYLDEINTPDKLKNYLDDVSTVEWPVTKFPQTSFHFTRCLLSLFYEDNVIEKYNLYKVTPEWKKALLQWFYDKQDPETGLWGPRSKSGKLTRKDTMNSTSILKVFIDKNGNSIYKEYPARYRDELARSILSKAFEPVPGDDSDDDWHEWNLNTGKSIKVLTQLLWDGLSDESRAETRKLIEHYIRIKSEKFYIDSDGAFSYYPASRHATLDGTSGVLGVFTCMGCFSEKNFLHIWGEPGTYITDFGSLIVKEIIDSDLKKVMNTANINSVRFYAVDPRPGDYSAGVTGIFYPRKTSTPDVIDLVLKMRRWISTTSQTMGNWTSREDIIQSLSEIKIKDVPVYEKELPLKELNKSLKKRSSITLIGFDNMQLPVCKISLKSR